MTPEILKKPSRGTEQDFEVLSTTGCNGTGNGPLNTTTEPADGRYCSG